MCIRKTFNISSISFILFAITIVFLYHCAYIGCDYVKLYELTDLEPWYHITRAVHLVFLEQPLFITQSVNHYRYPLLFLTRQNTESCTHQTSALSMTLPRLFLRAVKISQAQALSNELKKHNFWPSIFI